MMTNSGTHIILDLEWCDNELALETFYFRRELLNIIKDNGMNPLEVVQKNFKEKFWHLKGYSYTALILLEESHVSIHTFPLESENKKVAIDIYTCNYTRDNKEGTENIASYFIELFKASSIKNHLMLSR